jgi:predicted outer membrane lipoprotein
MSGHKWYKSLFLWIHIVLLACAIAALAFGYETDEDMEERMNRYLGRVGAVAVAGVEMHNMGIGDKIKRAYNHAKKWYNDRYRRDAGTQYDEDDWNDQHSFGDGSVRHHSDMERLPSPKRAKAMSDDDTQGKEYMHGTGESLYHSQQFEREDM